MDKSMLLRPRISEKAYALSLARNTYAFEVPTNANKMTIAAAVAAQYGVGVISVNIINTTGKTKRTIRRGGKVTKGQRSDTKKAYVTLKSGDSLPIFAEEKAAAEKETK